MSIEAVRDYLKQWDRDADILRLDSSTATVALAAQALGVEPARIAKSISLRRGDSAIVLVTAGDVRLDNRKYREEFGCKAKMLAQEEAAEMTGHPVGGVCPFGLPDAVQVYLDCSLQRFTTVFPACGTADSAIELTVAELAEYSRYTAWVDVCKGPGEAS